MSKGRALRTMEKKFFGKNLKVKETRFVQFSLIPIVALFIGIYIFPVFWGLYLSFFKCNPLMPKYPFVGLDNFSAALKDRLFWLSLKNSAFLVIVCTSINVILSLFFALSINRIVHFKAFFRAAFFVPTIMSMVCVSLIWIFIYSPSNGILNILLEKIGLQGQNWLGNPSLVLKSMAAPIIWRGLGYNIVIFLAGLQGIPQVYHEAAVIDGAGRWRIFWHITLPLLMPVTLFVSVVTVINTFQVFTPVQVMTEGGPGRLSLVTVLYIYESAFVYLKMGYGSAMAFILFSFILIFTLMQLRVFKSKWEY